MVMMLFAGKVAIGRAESSDRHTYSVSQKKIPL